MPEPCNDDLWREEEQDDSNSSMDSYLYLESSNDTEIITVPAEHVPRVYSEVEQTFQRERLQRTFRLLMDTINRETQDGGASDPHAVQYIDDTVVVQETVQNPTQDTGYTQIQDTNSTQIQDTSLARTRQETSSDRTQDTTQETTDTQDTQ